MVDQNFEIREVVGRQSGPIAALFDMSWPHGEAQVLRCNLANGEVIVAKRFRRKEKFERELWAYTHVTGHLAPHTPTLLWSVADTQILATTCLPGGLVEGTERERDPALHRLAGQLNRRFSEVIAPQQSDLYCADLLRTLQAWAERGKTLLSQDDVRAMAAIAGKAASVGRVPLVYQHGDNTPRNWVWTDSVGLCLIDFGSARWAYWTADLQRLRTSLWAEDLELQAAFLEGYGRELSERDRLIADAEQARDAVSTVVWAREHGDGPFEAAARTLITKIRRQQNL